MTTAVYDRRTKTLAADTQNTTPDGAIIRVGKIEQLDNGCWFLGSGHCYTISLCRQWAASDFKDTPDWSVFLDNQDDMGFACIVISKDGKKVWYLDDEMTVNEVMDEVVAVGSGAAYALGALDAGAPITKAMEIAAARDPNTSAPFHYKDIAGA